MEILYCERCGIRVPAKDLEEGRAIRGSEETVCAQCNKIKVAKPARGSDAHMLPGVTKSERRSEVGIKSLARSAAPAAHAAHRGTAPAKAGGNVVIIALSVALLVIGALLALRSNEKPTEASVARPAPEPVAPVARPAPVISNEPANHELPKSDPIVKSDPVPKVGPEPVVPDTPVLTVPKTDPEPAKEPKPEQDDRSVFEALMRFEGLRADDVQGQLVRVEAYLAEHPASAEAPRASAVAEELRKSILKELSTPVVAPTGPYRVTPQTTEFEVQELWTKQHVQMIWYPEARVPSSAKRYFRCTFDAGNMSAREASVLWACDDESKLYINGRYVVSTDDWRRYAWVGFAKVYKQRNVIAFECTNQSGPASLIARIRVAFSNQTEKTIDSDASWKCSDKLEERWFAEDFDDSAWKSSAVIANPESSWRNATQPKALTHIVEPDDGNRAGNQTKAKALAVFLKTDTETKGAWAGKHGQDGYLLAGINGAGKGESPLADNDLVRLPAYVQSISHDGGKTFGWSGATGALMPPEGDAKGIFANFGDKFSYIVRFNENRACRLALYCVDPFTDGLRKQRVELMDASNGTLLDSRSLEKFDQGTYCEWAVRCPELKITFTSLIPQSNAVCSGLFFAPMDGEQPALLGTPIIPAVDAKVAGANAAKIDAALSDINGLLSQRRWKDAYEQAEALKGDTPLVLDAERKARLAAMRQRAEDELVSEILRTDRVRLSGAKRQDPDGRWEFFYDFKNPAQQLDFIYPPNLASELDKGEALVCAGGLRFLFDFSGDLEISYETMPMSTHFGRVWLAYYDVFGELGGGENAWSATWRAVPGGELSPLARSETMKAIVNKWQRIDIAYEAKTKTTTISQDGKEGLKFSDPQGKGEGGVFLGAHLAGKFRNLRIKGRPTIKSLEHAEAQRKYAVDVGRRLTSGQPVPLFEKQEDLDIVTQRWQMVQDEAIGSGPLYVPGIGTANYELSFEARRMEGELQFYLRRNAARSWHVVLSANAVRSREWDHATCAEVKVMAKVEVDTASYHKFVVRSYGRTLRVQMDGKDILLDLKDVPVLAPGFYVNTFEGKGAIRKVSLRVLR